MKILVTADAVGGVWQYSNDLAKGLSQLGIETLLAVMGPSPSRTQAMAASAIKGVTLVDTGLPLDWLALSRDLVRAAGEGIAKLVARHDVDIVHLNSPGLAADVEYARPVVAAAHSCVATWWSAVKREPVCDTFKWRAELSGRGLAAAALCFAPSDAFAKATQQAHGLKRRPVTVYNGRSQLSLPKLAQHDCAFTAGRLWDKGKNIATLDKATEKLAIPFYAAGPVSGPNGDCIQLEHARAVGNLDEKQLGRWLASRPVFASAAIYEPFGLAVLEAAAAGCPLVLSDIPTFRELWHGVAAFVDPMDADGFAETISLIVRDDFARAEMGRRAQERAARFTVEAMAAKMATIYCGLAGDGQAAHARGNMVVAA